MLRCVISLNRCCQERPLNVKTNLRTQFAVRHRTNLWNKTYIGLYYVSPITTPLTLNFAGNRLKSLASPRKTSEESIIPFSLPYMFPSSPDSRQSPFLSSMGAPSYSCVPTLLSTPVVGVERPFTGLLP